MSYCDPSEIGPDGSGPTALGLIVALVMLALVIALGAEKACSDDLVALVTEAGQLTATATPMPPNPVTPAPAAPTQPAPFHYAIYGGTGTIVGKASRRMFVFSQAFGSYHAMGCLTEWGRVEGAAIGDGGKTVTLTDPKTFTTLEFEIGGACEAKTGVGIVSVGGFYGDVIDVDNGALKIVTTAPKTYGGLLTLGTERAGKWLSLGVGAHQAAGPGMKLLAAGQYPIKGNVSILADAAFPGALSFARVRVAVHP